MMYDDGPFNGLVGDKTSKEALSRKIERLVGQELRDYIAGFEDGERVQETEKNCFHLRLGTIYHNDDGCTCILWDKAGGEDGQMGTSFTEGSRRLSDLPNEQDQRRERRKNYDM